jgi:hypothetical protein
MQRMYFNPGVCSDEKRISGNGGVMYYQEESPKGDNFIYFLSTQPQGFVKNKSVDPFY